MKGGDPMSNEQLGFLLIGIFIFFWLVFVPFLFPLIEKWIKSGNQNKYQKKDIDDEPPWAA